MNDMVDSNSEDRYLKVREILNEALIRDILTFTFLYLFILAQSWNNILLLIFPLISFTFSIFFKILGTNKPIFEMPYLKINYHPIGLEVKHANRLRFTSIFQLILLFWIGAESLYHPQFISIYGNYFIIIFCLLYSFGFYWLMIDTWKYSKITITAKSNSNSEEIKKFISFLKFDKFRLIALVNLGYFCIINIINILLVLFFSTGLEFQLPGTGIENSEPLTLPFTILVLMVASPAILVFSLNLIYRDVNQINFEDFPNLLKDFSEEMQLEIINYLHKLNNKNKRNRDRLE